MLDGAKALFLNDDAVEGYFEAVGGLAEVDEEAVAPVPLTLVQPAHLAVLLEVFDHEAVDRPKTDTHRSDDDFCYGQRHLT